MNGTELIAAERQRQIEQEGWTPEHDDEHDGGCMAVAGACYALWAASKLTAQEWWRKQFAFNAQRLWQWDADWWKPKDPLRDLVRAGALIAAEIDKLQRSTDAKPTDTKGQP